MIHAPKYPASLTSEFEARLDAIAQMTPVLTRYKHLSIMLRELLDLLTADVPYVLAGPYAQVEYVIETLNPPKPFAIRRLRLHCRYPEKMGVDISRYSAADVRVMRSLIGLLGNGLAKKEDGEAESEAEEAGPKQETPAAKSQRRSVTVSVIDGNRLDSVKVKEVDGEEEMSLDLSAFDYMDGWLGHGTILSLIYFGEKLDLVVYEPDYLVDATTVASCFEDYAEDHRLATLNGLMPNEANKHTLLGLFAGQFLDEALAAVRRGIRPEADYVRSAKAFFRDNAICLATVEGIDASWHTEARTQQANVIEAVETLKRADPNFNPKMAATEVSLIGPSIGLQGRADLLQSDWRLLIEQKSGKWKFPHGGPTMKHYVQMVIYKMMRAICYDIYRKSDSFYFLYSKYRETGVIREGQNWAESDGRWIMQLRNQYVRDKFRYTRAKELAHDLLTWRTDDFRKAQGVNERFWSCFIAPRFDSFFGKINSASSVERNYVFEMLAFLHREELISRLGGSSHGRDGFASLWTASVTDRANAGEALFNLSYAGMERDEAYDAAAESDESSILVLASPRESDGLAEPNFRQGDPIVIYDYPEGGQPDISSTIYSRATLLSIVPSGDRDLLRIKLHSPSGKEYFARKGRKWAVEHDMYGSIFTKQGRSVVSLLSADKARRNMVMAQRRPVVGDDDGGRLLDHGPMNQLVERQLRARELFLLVGPPGTGKTSMGLMSILREELARPAHTVLLLSYTNRAVDEICSKLEKDGLQYVRIGQRFACDEQYRHRLLQMVCSEREMNVDALRKFIADVRIVVGTTATISGSDGLLAAKRFDLAIVDEASQILEPSIIGIMASMTKSDVASRPSVGRFVLIGDERQLPAVVQQRRWQSRVEDPSLNKIGLLDCRDSFFERMIRLYGADDALVYRLTRHGRMHPDVAAFCNKHFYAGTLTPIPLPHQSMGLDISALGRVDALGRKLYGCRACFIDSHIDGVEAIDAPDKVNPHEADLVARVAMSVLSAWREAGNALIANETLGIIVPYRNQISAIRNRLVRLAAADEELYGMARGLTIDTVERLQGSERETIIYGFTVSRISQLQFLKESQYVDSDGNIVDRKLNVALSRARERLIVVGDEAIISTVPLYADLVKELERVEVERP